MKRENQVDEIWKCLCCKFIGRTRRMERFKKAKGLPKLIMNKEKELVQKAYDEMTEQCLKDPQYLAIWENNI